MTRITLGLALSLLGSAAMAQTPPAPPPAIKQPAAGPATAPAPGAGPQAAPQTPPTPPSQQSAANGQPAIPTPSGPPEGMVVETPDGFYLVRPGEGAPQRLGIQPRGPRMGRNAAAADEPMGDMDEEGMQPPPPQPHRAPPPRPPEGKGARFHVRTPNMTLDVKCPDDEPMKACADAVAALVDKLAQPAH